jgi:glycosyltransferase involved in cell wall biosynthesis|nr:glycosyltransferase family 4 protein [Methanoculleus bourgensis]
MVGDTVTTRIAILCNTFSGSVGVDRVVARQAKNLSNMPGNHVTIFTLKQEMSPPDNVEVRVIGMPHGFIAERLWRLSFPLNAIKIVQWLPMLKEYDIVYSHQYPLNWLAYLGKRRYGIKYIYYHHHLNPPEAYDGFLQHAYARMLNSLTLWSAKKADDAISISQYSRKSLLEDIGLDSTVIYDEIDLDRFHPDIDGAIIRRKHNLDNNPVMLYVGGITPPKRIKLLIEAYYIVKDTIPDIKLIIVGKGSFDGYYRDLKKMSDDSVIFTGYISDDELPYYYAGCDVYATASLWEGFNLPLVEAQACGKPVVAFDVGAHSEVVSTPENGLLVPAADVSALAGAVLKIIQSRSGCS